MPVIFEPESISSVPPLLTVTSEAILSLNPRKLTLFPKISVTPLPTVKSEPLDPKLTDRSVVPPTRVMLTVLLL